MFIAINKPKGITSHDVIYKLRKITGIRKIGHAGTLDPNATGLLIVGIGRQSTKRLGTISTDTKKNYVAEIVLGEERETDDIEGEVREIAYKKKNNKPTKEDIEKVLNQFVGTTDQIPPSHSAIKIKGKKAYELARKGKDVNLKSRKVTIYSIKLLEYKYPILKIDCEVSSGTYIRALARDIGRELGTGAHLNNLVRTKTGKYSLENAVDLGQINSSNWENYAFEL